MSIHYVIIADLANTKNDVANLDVGTDQAPAILYTVSPCTSPAPAPVRLNDSQFASSPDCFHLASSLPALVFAQTVDGQTPPQPLSVPSQATLRQKKLVMAVPPVEVAAGTLFAFPIGDLGTGAQLLIANPGTNASDCSVVIAPSPNTPPTTLTVALGCVVSFPLPAASSGARVVVSSPNGIPLIVQLAILGHGQEFSMTMIPRIAP